MIISNVAKVIKDQPLSKTSPDDTVANACKVMCQHDVRAVVVLENDKLVGVLSERDVIRKCICSERHTAETRVSEIMTTSPKTVNADDSLAKALEIMGQGGFHHVPVLHDEKTVGLLSSDEIPEEYRMMLERFKEIRGS